jgi:hypothetical protein
MESEPVQNQDVVEEPVAQEPAQNQVVEEPVSQEPAQNQVVEEEPVQNQEEPVQNQEEPVAQEPVEVVEPVSQEPVQNQDVEEPVQNQDVEEPVQNQDVVEVVEPVQNQVIEEEPVQTQVVEEPVQNQVAQEPVQNQVIVEEPVQNQVIVEEPVVEEEPVQNQVIVEAPVVEEEPVQNQVIVEEPAPEIIIPTTHKEIDSLNLFFIMKHCMSEMLLIRAMHSMLHVVPDAWTWVSNVDITNVNEGVDPMFDAIQHHMNEQTDFKRDVTWELRKNAFVWIIRQLNYIAKHGVPQYKTLYANYNPTMDIEGLWVQSEAGI